MPQTSWALRAPGVGRLDIALSKRQRYLCRLFVRVRANGTRPEVQTRSCFVPYCLFVGLSASHDTRILSRLTQGWCGEIWELHFNVSSHSSHRCLPLMQKVNIHVTQLTFTKTVEDAMARFTKAREESLSRTHSACLDGNRAYFLDDSHDHRGLLVLLLLRAGAKHDELVVSRHVAQFRNALDRVPQLVKPGWWACATHPRVHRLTCRRIQLRSDHGVLRERLNVPIQFELRRRIR